MSRAAGRGSKGAQAKPEAGVGEAVRASLLDQVGGETSESTRLQLYGASEPCGGACKRTTKSPNCFCHLVPAVGSHREGGLWARVPKGAYEAPSSQRRTVRLPRSAAVDKTAPAHPSARRMRSSRWV